MAPRVPLQSEPGPGPGGRRCRPAPEIWLLLVLVLSAGCRSEAPRPREAAEAPAADPAPAAAAPQPAAVVNDREITRDAVKRLARRTGWSAEKSLRALVDSTLVIREAARLGQACAAPEKPEACARELLERLYSPANTCRNITDAEVDSAYRQLFDKDWPVEAYAGWIAGIRCCGGDRGDCDAPEAAACRQGLGRWGPPVEALATAWAAGTPVEPAVDRIFSAGTPLRVSDFFLTYWPESGPEDQPQLASWDPMMLAELVSLPTGEVSKPVRSDMGLHVFRLDRYKPARLKDDPELRGELAEKICEDRVARVRDRYVGDLRATASIRMH